MYASAMDLRPPPSIVVTVASATALGALGLATAAWNVAASRGAWNVLQSSVGPVLGSFWIGYFIVQTLRRKRSVRAFAIAISLVTASLAAIITSVILVDPSNPDRWRAAVPLGAMTALPALIGL
jgi:hypothetical protein